MSDISQTIEPDGDHFIVIEHGTYGRNSVLAGQAKRTYIDRFDTVEAAKKSYPDATLLGYSTKPFRCGDTLAEISGLPSNPPAWFDPADAGERWDDDY